MAKEMQNDPPPPPVQPENWLDQQLHPCGFTRREVRRRFPTLASFAASVAFEDGDLIFASGREAIDFHLDRQPSNEREKLRRALREEARTFELEFPAGHECRQTAWWALGANSGAPDFVTMLLDALQRE